MVRFFSPILCLILAVLMLRKCKGQEETLCRGVALNMTPEQKTVIADCLTEAKIESIWKIPPASLACFGVCVLKKKNLLTAEGRFDHEKVIAYIDLVMRPDEVKSILRDGMEKCYKENGDDVDIANDPTCAGFKKVGMCAHDLFFSVCMP